MTEEVVRSSTKRRPCPACGSESARGRGSKNGLEMFSCRGCATLYTSALPDADGAQNYDEYYDAHNLSVPDFIHLRLAEIVAGFEPYRGAGRLLDIGCGAGTVLEAARRAGWEAEGVEVSHPAVEHLRAAGFSVFHGELAEARYPADHFDVIVASEVLEHLPDPRVLLREAARVLRPGGLLWATTPHSRGASARALGIGWSDDTAAAGWAGDSRVESSYSLNESLTRNRALRTVKGALNAALNLTRLGDSLKITAEK
ncbi:MAG: class I SAM-dependent methyltransferase [Acidobacteria bacterium]|nr:class I SAM-dependent methyltransferase [Acidobacteriota bacterium]